MCIKVARFYQRYKEELVPFYVITEFIVMTILDNILFKGNYVIILRVIRGILCD